MAISLDRFRQLSSQAGGDYKKYNQLVDSVRGNRALTTQETHDSNQALYEYTSNKGPTSRELNTDYIQDFLKSQETGGYFGSIESDMFRLSQVYGDLDRIQKSTESGSEQRRKETKDYFMEKLAGGLNQYYTEQKLLLEEINIRAGLTGKISEEYRENITKVQPELLRMGISYDDLASSATKLVEQTGKFTLMSSDSFRRMGEVAKAYVGTLGGLVGMFPEFERIGVGAIDATEKISEAGRKSLGLGLQAQKTVKDLSSNIGKLNEYGFKNGIDGLTRMIQRANEFRISLDSVYQIADKVLNPEGALELTANLQVLGGAIGDFNDPLKLMYMATNNVEGLQDALIGAASSLTTYNTEQKRFEITGVNLRRAKEMASQLGISYQELSKGAIAAAERAAAADALFSRGLTFKKDEDREFLMNISQMRGGKMVIDIGGSTELSNFFRSNEVALDSLTEAEKEKILEFKKDLEDKTEQEIIRNQATAIGNMERDVNFIAASLRLAGGEATKAAAELTGFNLLKDIVSINVEKGAGEIGQYVKIVTEALKETTGKEREMIQKEYGEYLKKYNVKVDEELKTPGVVSQQGKMTEETFKKTETPTTTTKETEVTQKRQLEITMKVDPAADEISRMMQKYPYLFANWDDSKSYTQQ